MAGPGGKEVGRLSIRVVADTTEMTRDIKKAGDKAEPLSINVDADTLAFEEQVQRARAEASKGTVTIEVDADVDAKGLRERVRAAARAASTGTKVNVGVEASFAEFTVAAQRLRTMAERESNVTIAVDPTVREIAVQTIERRFAELRRELERETKVSFVIDTDGATVTIDKWRADVSAQMDALGRELGRQKWNLRLETELDLNIANLNRAIADTDAAFANFDSTLRDINTQTRINVEQQKQMAKEVEEAHKRAMDRIEMRSKRVALWAELFRRKVQLAFGSIAIGGLITGVQLVGGYLTAGAVQATALAGAMIQAVGAAAVLPGLLAGAAASIGVLVTGFQGFGEALSQIWADEQDPAALEKALSKLTPSARAAATALGGLKPVLTDLKNSLQESLFVGLDAGIARLDGFVVQMEGSLSAIASGWNATFKGLLDGLTNSSTIASLSTTFTNFGSMMTTFASGLSAAVRGFSSLSAAGSQFFGAIGTYGAQKMREFEGWVGRITTDGSFERWVKNGTQAFSEMWGTVKNLSASLANIFRVSGGGAMLFQLQSMTASLREYTESARGMTEVGRAFDGAREFARNFHQVIKDLSPLLGELVVGAGDFASVFATSFGPAMEGSKDAARDFMDMLEGLAPSMAETLGAAVEGIGELSRDLGPDLAELAQQIAPLIGEITEFASGAGQVFIEVLTAALNVINNLVGAIPGLSTGLGAVFGVMASAKFAGDIFEKLGLLSGAFTGAGAAADGAKGKVGGFVGALTGGLLKAAVPVAAAVGYVSFVIDAIAPSADEAAQSAANLSAAMKNLATAEVYGGVYEQTEAVKAYEAAASKAEIAQKKYNEEVLAYAANSAAAVGGQGTGGGTRAWVESTNEAADASDRASLGLALLTGALKLQYESLSPVEQAQVKVNAATKDLAAAQEKYGATSAQAAAAADKLAAASWALELAKKSEAAAQKTAAEAIQDQIEAQSSLLALQGDAAQAQLNVNSAVEAYTKAVAEHGEGSLEAQAALGQLSTATQIATQNIGAAAQAAAVATGASDGLTESYAAQISYLDSLIAKGGDQAIVAQQQKDALIETTAAAILTTAGFADLKNSIVAVPNSKSVIISDNSPETIKKLKDLGYTVQTLPDGTVKVTANTEPALAGAQSVVTKINKMSGTITIYTNSSGVSLNTKTGTRYEADGGYISGPGGPTDDLIPAMLSNGEYVIRAAAVKFLGVDTLNYLNSLGAGRADRRAGDITGKFAGGGSVNDWFSNAVARAANEGRTSLGEIPVRMDGGSGGGGNTFILPDVDPHSLAAEIDRLNGFHPAIVGVS